MRQEQRIVAKIREDLSEHARLVRITRNALIHSNTISIDEDKKAALLKYEKQVYELLHSDIRSGNVIYIDESGFIGATLGQDGISPPRLAQFVLLLVPPGRREHVIGDLEEEFKTILIPRYGTRIAKLYYRWHVALEVIRAAAAILKDMAWPPS